MTRKIVETIEQNLQHDTNREFERLRRKFLMFEMPYDERVLRNVARTRVQKRLEKAALASRPLTFRLNGLPTNL